MDKHRLVESRGERWTRAEDYVTAMARKRSARRNRASSDAKQPDAPRTLAGTVPFLVLIMLLGVLAAAVMVLAFPGNQPEHKPTPTAAHQLGTADRGWFQEAQKQFR